MPGRQLQLHIPLVLTHQLVRFRDHSGNEYVCFSDSAATGVCSHWLLDAQIMGVVRESELLRGAFLVKEKLKGTQ